METHKNTQDRPAVPLTSDLVFKYVFGGEHSTRYLRSLLSAIQEDAGYPAIATVEIANPFNLQDTEDAKLSVVDVRARDVNGVTFTVEAQSTNHQAFGSRVLCYWAKTYGAQLREGDFYTTLKPVVGMNLLDFRLFPPEFGAPLHTTFVPSCVQKPALPPLPDLVLHFLELPRYNQDDAPTSTALERWVYFIISRGRADAMEDPVMKQILKESPDIAAWSAPEGACSVKVRTYRTAPQPCILRKRSDAIRNSLPTNNSARALMPGTSSSAPRRS